jgi:hypothetical protein
MQQAEQEPVPQPVAGVQDRLHLSQSEHTRQLARRPQRDRTPGLRLAFADVVQKWLPRCAPPPGGLPGDQQLAEIDAAAGRVLIERAQRRELAVDRGLAAIMLHRGQHRDRAVPRGYRAP